MDMNVIITDGNNSVKINSDAKGNQTNYCFHCYNTVTVAENKMKPITIIRMIMSYVGSGSLMPAD